MTTSINVQSQPTPILWMGGVRAELMDFTVTHDGGDADVVVTTEAGETSATGNVPK